MKLKTRLTIAFITIVLGTVFLVSAAVLGVSARRLNAMERQYGEEMSLGSVLNAVQTVSDSTQKILENLQKTAKEDPDQFLNFSFLQEENSELENYLSYLILVKENELYYTGSTEDDWSEDLELLRDTDSSSEEFSYYIGGSKKAMVKQVHVVFSDQTEGNAYIVTSIHALIPEFKSIFYEMAVLVIVVLMGTAFIMTLWIYSGIKRPIEHLCESAKRISNGDYQFSIEPEGDEEIRQLCEEFEKMRNRLAESEAQKEKYDAENRELITNISHDLKTPVTTVKGYVEGIMDGVADTPEKLDHYIKTIYTKANDMDRLINELTFYTKIDANRIPYNFTRLDVAAFCDDCAEEMELELQDKGIRFTYMNKISPKVRIIADPEQLRRVMDNIFGNAIKYMNKSNGHIELRLLDVGDFIQIEVQDNGKGIETKDLTRIFDRFYRTDESRNSLQGGSGIGLSIVKKIIDDHAGRIWATSTAGRGTTIHFVIRKYEGASEAK